jgi:predicted glycogen debranching enzyme
MLEFGRDICGDEQQAARREWLVTNGIGGYASGTVGGMLTRRYHGLLVAALQPPLGRTLLVTKLDETASYDGYTYPLFANRWEEDIIDPPGFFAIEQFRLEGTTPVWTFACADALLEKRIWMQQGANTTYVSYTLRRAHRPLALTIKALVNYRDFHNNTYAADWQMQVAPVAHGLRVDAFFGAQPFYLLSDRATAAPQHEWYYNFWLSVEQHRGLGEHDDHLYAGEFQTILQPGDTLTFVASTEEAPSLDGAAAYATQQQHEKQLLARSGHADAPFWTRQLTLAASQFIVGRPSDSDPDGQTIIAGYPWFGDWGRDTMISLPGLTLSTGRTDVAARILRTFARFSDQGMLPNLFPNEDIDPHYNTVDAVLWYIEAVRAYHDATGDDELLRELFPVLREMFDWYHRGTRYHIQADPEDGLLYAGEEGVQLTWMDAKIDEWVVTPRIGKPVEVNALWYNALRVMAKVAARLGEDATDYEHAAERVQASFERFWNSERNSCYDVIDGPEGNDATLRPNQIFAVALPYSPLSEDQQREVVDSCARHLLCSYGLRSLSPKSPDYIGTYGGGPVQRDSSYHQGTAWAWLIGPFASAHLRVYGDPIEAQSYLLPFAHHLTDQGVGSISEIFDGDAPFMPRGCIAQAWSVAEVLRVWQLTQHARLAQPLADA